MFKNGAAEAIQWPPHRLWIASPLRNRSRLAMTDGMTMEKIAP